MREKQDLETLQAALKRVRKKFRNFYCAQIKIKNDLIKYNARLKVFIGLLKERLIELSPEDKLLESIEEIEKDLKKTTTKN